MSAWLIGERYEMLSPLGGGAQGQVWRAWDRELRRVAALKLRPYRGAADDAALAEARALRTIGSHPGLPTVREVFVDAAQWVLDMDWIDGENAADLLERRGRPGLAVEDATGLLSEVAAALHHLHQLDPAMVHGDVKPSNIVVRPDRGAVLVDFGISSQVDVSPGRPYLTKGYAAPEVARGEARGPAADVYSLAACTFTLLTGVPPGGVRVPPEDARRKLLDAVRPGLATDPSRRPGVGELVGLLEAAAGVASRARGRSSVRPAASDTPLGKWAFERSAVRLEGRQEPLALLLRLWEEAVDGARRLVVVTGEAGSGKSAIVAELARRAHAEGAQVLFGQSRRTSVARAVDDIVQHLADYGSDRWFVGDAVSVLSAAFPALGDRLRGRPSWAGSRTGDHGPADEPSIDVDAAIIGLALDEVISTASADRPTLVVLEDVQWLDRVTMQTMVALTVSALPGRVAVVATVRDGDDADVIEENRRLLLEIRRDRERVHQIRLDALDRSAVEAMIIGLGNRGTTPGFLSRFTEISRGNPGIIAGVIAELGRVAPERARHTLTEADLLELSTPEAARHLQLRRIERLSAPARRLLAVAAFVGEEVHLGVLRRVAAIPHDEFDELFLELIDAELVIRPSGRAGFMVFTEELTRFRASTFIEEGTRAKLHWQVHLAMSELQPSELDGSARHAALAAEAGEPGRILGVLRHAAKDASARGRPEQAEAHLAAALRLAEGAAAVASQHVLLELVLEHAAQLLELNRVADAHAASHRAMSLAEALGDPDSMATAAWLSISTCGGTEDLDERERLIDRALRAQPPEATRTRVQLLTTKGQQQYVSTSGREGNEALAEAERLAHVADDEWTDVWMIGAGRPRRGGSRDLQSTAEFCRRSIPRAIAVGNDFLGKLVLPSELMVTLTMLGDRPGVEEVIAGIAQRSGKGIAEQRLVDTARAALMLADGDVATARALIERSFAACGFQDVDRFERDLQLLRADELSGKELAVADRARWTFPAIRLGAELVAIASSARRGGPSLAGDALSDLRARAAPPPFLPRTTNHALSRLAELSYWTHAPAEAELLESHLAPWSGTLIVLDDMIWIEGAVDRFLGILSLVLGDRNRAIEQFRAAIALEERFRAPGLVAESTRWLERALNAGMR